jgi:hypothetical protein
VQDIRALNKSVQLSSAAQDFVAYAKTMMATDFRPKGAATIPDLSPRLRNILTKTAVPTGTMADATWAGPLGADYKIISDGFISSLQAWSAWDQLFPDMHRMPLQTRIVVATNSARGNAISELASKPLTSMTFSNSVLQPRKVVSFIVLSKEAVRSIAPAATVLIGNELRRGCALETDSLFLSTLSEGTGVASLASTGPSAAQFLADLGEALDAVTVGADSRLYLIVPPGFWKILALMRDAGGPVMTNSTIGGIIRVVPSDAAEQTATGYLVDARGVAAENDVVNLLSAEHASVQMDDSPTSGAQTLISLWQNDLVGMRCERWLGCELLRSDSACLITGLTMTV